MRRWAALAALVLPAVAQAQDMPGMAGMQHSPGMTMPPAHAAPATPKAAPHRAGTAAKPTPHAHAHASGAGTHDDSASEVAGPPEVATPTDHDAMPGMAGMDHAGMAMPADVAPAGTALPAGTAAAPAPPQDFYADRRWGSAAMDVARHRMMREEGGRSFYQALVNLAEYQVRSGGDGFRWDGEAWFGRDLDRFVLRTEGEGDARGGVDTAEAQTLWSHAVGRYANLQGGLRQDLGREPKRTYAALGIETLVPFNLEAEARLFLSTRGELLARIEGWYDQRVTQRLVLQPRVEFNLAAQSRASTATGAGLTEAELGLRLRYEIARRFAPYVGISYQAATGRTARYLRAADRDPATTSLVAGIRFWF